MDADATRHIHFDRDGYRHEHIHGLTDGIDFNVHGDNLLHTHAHLPYTVFNKYVYSYRFRDPINVPNADSDAIRDADRDAGAD